MRRIVLTRLEDCSGCRTCEITCSRRHNGSINPKRARIRVVKAEPGIDAPIVCYQCRKPPCKEHCPTGAIETDDRQGIVVINEEKCIGCGICVDDCPFGAMMFDEDKGVAMKCDLCGGEPKCVKDCPKGALRLLSNALLSQTKQREWITIMAKEYLGKYGVSLFS